MALVAATLGASAHAAPQDAPPPSGIPGGTPPAPAVGELPFSRLPYEEARAQAVAAGKLFLVDATATWCMPCKQMEAEAWPAQAVRDWVAQHAVAVQVDVDEQPELARALEIEAMPTMIVFRGEAELGRYVGMLEAAELVTWLEAAAAGRAGPEALREEASALDDSNDPQARYDLAKKLLRSKQYDLALEHFLWLWPNTEGRAIGPVRGSFMLGDMRYLVDRYEPAREAFAKIFDELVAKVADSAQPDQLTWNDLTRWCEAFDRQDVLHAWHERHGAWDGSVTCPWAAETLAELFLKDGDYVAAGQLGHLVARAATEIRHATAFMMALEITGQTELRPPARSARVPDRDELKAFREKMLRTKLVRLSAAAWAVGRDDEARSIAALLLAELDDAASRLELVDITLVAVGARPELATWLDVAAERGGDAETIAALRARLDAAQNAPPSPVAPASAPEPLR